MFGHTGPTLTKQQVQRYEQDRQLLSEMLPAMRHLIHADGRGAIAQGSVEVDVGAGCWETVQIEIVFGRDYPRMPPRIFETGRRWRPEDDRHIMDNHEFCLWLKHVDTPSFASIDDLRREILRLLMFLRDQFVYDDLGKRWPGPQWKHHAPAAYAQHLTEALHITDPGMFCRLWPAILGQGPDRRQPCPCGSGIPYRRCHLPAIGDLSWVRTLKDRDRIPNAVEEQMREAA
jgi:hypothetical protein